MGGGRGEREEDECERGKGVKGVEKVRGGERGVRKGRGTAERDGEGEGELRGRRKREEGGGRGKRGVKGGRGNV